MGCIILRTIILTVFVSGLSLIKRYLMKFSTGIILWGKKDNIGVMSKEPVTWMSNCEYQCKMLAYPNLARLMHVLMH